MTHIDQSPNTCTNMDSASEIPAKAYESLDHSVLQTPLNIRPKNVRQIITALNSGTDEVKNVLTNECNIIYECKICCNLFRCLANFIAHKRFYCKDKTNIEGAHEKSTLIIQAMSEEESASVATEDEFAGYQEDRNIFTVTGNPIENKRWTRSDDPMETVVKLEKIPSNPNAVFQALTKVQPESGAKLRTADQNVKPLIPKPGSSSLKYSNSFNTRKEKLSKRTDCNLVTMECLKCKMGFMNVRTLYYHMINRHTLNTVRYPCPYCNTTCVQAYGVLRHMMRTHHKTKEQVARLRDTIQKRGFIRNNPSNTPNITNIKARSKMAPKKRSFFKCSKCHRSFDRKSSQVSHEKYCSKFSLKCTNCQKNFTTKNALSSHQKICNRKLFHKCRVCHRVFDRKSSQVSHEKHCGRKALANKKCPKCGKLYSGTSGNCTCKNRRVMTHPKRIKEPEEIKTPLPRPPQLRVMYKIESTGTTISAETKPIDFDLPQGKSMLRRVTPLSSRQGTSRSSPGLSISRPRRCTGKREDKDFVDSQSLKWRSANKLESVGTNSDPQKTLPVDTPVPTDILDKITVLMNEKTNSCIKCHRKFSSISNLRRHVATHIGYNRYKCHQCEYASFYRSDCRQHIARNHPGDSKQADDLIISVHTVSSELGDEEASSSSSSTSVQKPMVISSMQKSPPILLPVSTPTFRMDSLKVDTLRTYSQMNRTKKVMPDLSRQESTIPEAKSPEPSEPKTPKTTTTKPIIITTLIKRGVTTLRVNNKPKASEGSTEIPKKMQKLAVRVEPLQERVVKVDKNDHNYQSSSPPENDPISEVRNGDIENSNDGNVVLWAPSELKNKDETQGAGIPLTSFATLVTRAGTYQKKIGPKQSVESL